MRRLLLISTLLAVLGIAQKTIAQDFSNKGKEFWIAYSYHVGMNSGNPPTMTLYLTCDITTTYTVEIFGVTTLSSGTINANQVVPVVIPTTYFINADGLFTGKAIRVTAAKPIVVYSFITRNQASAASLCLPTNVLGREYYASSFTQNSNENNSNSYITIVGVEDNTTIEIIPTAATVGGWAAGSTNSITINKGQVYQVLGTTSGNSGVDLSGTSVKSIASGGNGCKKIAVYSGSGKISIGSPAAPPTYPNACSGSSADNLYQQLYPVASWGKRFLTVPSYSRPYNHYRIYRINSVTNVYLNGTLIPSASFSNNFYQFYNNTANQITSDQPISVSQYFTSQNCPTNLNPYDPDMIMLSPVEQNINNVTLVNTPLTVSGTHQHHLHILMRNDASNPGATGQSSFRFDGNTIPLASWTAHPQDPNYSYLYLSNVSAGNHRIQSDSGFNALAYGYGNAETYGYSAGANVKDLSQQIGFSFPNAQEVSNYGCHNTPFKYKVAFPATLAITSMTWNFNGTPMTPNNNNVVVPSPVIDSTTLVNGKLLNWYSLPTQYTVTNPGSYNILITIQVATPDACGNEQEYEFPIVVTENPAASFTYPSIGCVAEQVQFTETTGQTPKPTYKFWWEFKNTGTGAITNSNVRNPNITFANPGTYQVRFANITTPGCLSDTATQTVVVPDIPDASFTVDNATVCINATEPQITFVATEGKAPYTFTYNINGGASQTIQTTGTNSSVILNVPTNVAGSFRYNLTEVKNTGSTVCVRPKSNTFIEVVVNANTGLSLDAGSNNAQAICQNSAISDISYSISGGGTNASIISWTPSAPAGITGVFNNATKKFTISGTSTGAPGVYTYTVEATGPCIPSQLSGTITVNELPTATISGTTEVCKDAPMPQVVFTGSGGTAPYTFSYTLNSVAQTPVVSTASTFTINVPTSTTGTYTYELTSVKDASSTLCSQAQTGIATVIVNPLPTPNFNFTSPACATRTISFQDLSTPNVGTLTAWNWNFNDAPANSALQNPTHTFNNVGTYSVELTVTNSKGCTIAAPFTRAVNIRPRPKAGFIVPEVCINDVATLFTDTSSVIGDTFDPAGYLWNFADPGSGAANTATTQNGTHLYTAIGLYTNVMQVVTTASGCKDTAYNNIFINAADPVADFTITPPASWCSNDSVSLINRSSVSQGNVTKLEIYWDATGAPTTFETIDVPVFTGVYKHKYPTSTITTTYNVKLIAYSGTVCHTEKTIPITVYGAPVVLFNTVPDVCFDAAPFQLTQATETGGVPGTPFYSGPGVSSTGIFNPASVVPGSTNTIKFLWTSTAGGCKDSTTQTVTVLDTATARFSWQPVVCEKSDIAFNSSTSSIPASAGSIVGWQWNFADPASGANNTSTLQNPLHNFAAWGNYNVTLQVISDKGCRSTVRTIPVHVNPLPIPTFSFPASACLPSATLAFNSSLSSIPDGSQSTFSYLWNFGDPASGTNNTATTANPSHIFNSVGPFSVNLQITSGAGCPKDTTIPVNTIHPQPIADFLVDKTEVCVGDGFVFTDNTNPMDGVTTSWSWNLDDGNTRTVRTFPYTYSVAGTYDVELYTINSHGCRSTTFTGPVTVHPYPVVDAGPDRFVLEGGQITLEPVVTGNDLNYVWTPNNSYIVGSNAIKNLVVKGVEDIRYLLTVTARGGCTDTSSVFIKVLKNPGVPNIFSPNGDGVHDKWIISYLETYPGCTVDIYNRYGQLIFHSVGYQVPWDGKVNGRDVPVGTYYYIVNPKNGRSIMSGYVDVIR